MDVKGLRPLDVVAAGVLLRPWRDEDIDVLWEALQDPEIRTWNGSGSGSYDEAADFIRRRQDWRAGATSTTAHRRQRDGSGQAGDRDVDAERGRSTAGEDTAKRRYVGVVAAATDDHVLLADR